MSLYDDEYKPGESEKRRELCSSYLNAAGIEFEFFRGTNGRKMTPEEQALVTKDDHCILPLGKDIFGRNLGCLCEDRISPGEAGCAMSHLRVYQHILDLGLDYACVVEDDAIIHPDVKYALDACEKEYFLGQWDIVSFSGKLGVKDLPEFLRGKKYYFGPQDNPRLGYFRRVGMRYDPLDVLLNGRRFVTEAHMYVINRKGCERLIELGYPIRLSPDYLYGHIAYHKLRFYRAYPLFHYAYQPTTGSIIDERPKHERKRIVMR